MTAVLQFIPAVLHAAIGVTRARAAAARSGAERLLAPFGTSVRPVLERIRTSGAQAGMSTAEYAVGLVAACAFAAVLYKILTSSTMQSLLRDLISRALHVTL